MRKYKFAYGCPNASGERKEAREMEDEIWIQRDGTGIAVSDMSEEHAKNALRMMIRNFNCRRDLAFSPDGLDFYCAKAEVDDAGSR